MGRFRLWLIEPNHFLREGMRYLLHETDFKIVVAASSADAAMTMAGTDR